MGSTNRHDILGLDPSSTVVGYGCLTISGDLVEAGTVLPERRIDPSWVRIMDLCDEVDRLLARVDPGVVLVEWTRGKVNRRRHTGRGAGLAVYGAAVGAVARQCWLWAMGRAYATVYPVAANVWTRGVSKGERQIAIAAQYPEHSHQILAELGGDMADGIGLAAWWITENLVR